jgi:sigma-B regulation protein RsbU (phosphoserine phosphatase)
MTDVPTVLIVDDDAVTVRVLEAMLGQEGYRTLSARDGASGRAQAAAHRPDLVLLDVQMPGQNGIEVCRALKADPDLSAIPVLFVSGEGDVASKVAGLDAGAVDYVTKPFHRAEVLARVRTHLRLSRATRAVVELQAVRVAQLASAQHAILPQPLAWPDARFAVEYRPLYEAGGDFYDVLQPGEGVIDYLVADVSGHDLASALPTAALKALLHQNCSITESPEQALRTVNSVLRTVLPEGHFATLVYARVNRARKRATLVSAGHPPVIHAPVSGPAMAIEQSGDVIGAFDVTVFEQRAIAIEPGDRLFLYSDGLVQPVPGVTQDQQVARLRDLCEASRGRPLAEALAPMIDEILDGGEPRDDIVLMGVEA